MSLSIFKNAKSIRTKIIFAFSLILSILITFQVYTFISNKYLFGTVEHLIEEDMEILELTHDLSDSMNIQLASVRGYLLSGNTSYIEQFNTYSEKSIYLHQKLGDYKEHYVELEEAGKIEMDWIGFVNTSVFPIFSDGNSQRAIQNLASFESKANEIQVVYENASKKITDDIHAFGEELSFRVNFYTGILIFFSIISIIVSTIVTYKLSRMIVTPVRRIMHRMTNISNGDLTHVPLEIDSKDELASLTEETNAMTTKLQDIVHLIQNEASSLSVTSISLKETSHEVTEGTSQTAQTVNQIAEGSEEQALAASHLRDLMTHFTLVMDETYDNSKRVEELSSQVQGKANHGLAVMDDSEKQMQKIDSIVKDSVTRVAGLNERTKEISQLVTVITSIADQTNLLALNAAIEAARAGEHGKGFAVVAEEVRKLAEQVSSSVQTISTIVVAIQKEANQVTQSLQGGYAEVEKGSEQVSVSNQTYHEISVAISEMAGTTKEMATKLNDIQEASKKIDQAIENIAAVTEEAAASSQETAATIEEVASSMENITGQANALSTSAEHLEKLAHQFKL